jgi:hypothetical protein
MDFGIIRDLMILIIVLEFAIFLCQNSQMIALGRGLKRITHVSALHVGPSSPYIGYFIVYCIEAMYDTNSCSADSSI